MRRNGSAPIVPSPIQSWRSSREPGAAFESLRWKHFRCERPTTRSGTRRVRPRHSRRHRTPPREGARCPDRTRRGAHRLRHAHSQIPELFETPSQGGTGARGAFDEHPRSVRHLGQGRGVRIGVADQSSVVLVHEVARMRHDVGNAVRPAALQLTLEALQALGAQLLVRGREVDQVAVVGTATAIPVRAISDLKRSTSSGMIGGSRHWLGVLVNSWMAWAPTSAPQAGPVEAPPSVEDVGAEEVGRLHAAAPVSKESGETRGTNRTPPAPPT